ncbi:thymidylate synthase [Pseudoalteromonas phage J2-1_QLiu-2017]|nr:thymidylate synthase [Pseudoalteromonas phage J2-1_QLiu-2017]
MNTIYYEENVFQPMIQAIMESGVDVKNDRTGTICRTLPHFVYQMEADGVTPFTDGKPSFPISAVAEMIGYLRGYTDAQQFADIGTRTWFVNANETQAWLENKNRKGENDIGKAYGAIARDFGGIDLVKKVYNNLKAGVDDRGETITFWKPDDFDKACLRPCMRTHTFTLLGEHLFLFSESRSVDMFLGFNFNSIQALFLLKLMAKITGHKAGMVTHAMINSHIYDKHFEQVEEYLGRSIKNHKVSFEIADWVTCLEDVIDSDRHARDYIVIEGDYDPQEKIEAELVA